MSTENGWVGISSFEKWSKVRKERGLPVMLDVALITHPRDEEDVPRLLPWSAKLTHEERREMVTRFMPSFGEIIEAESLRVGILFLPMFAADIIDPATRMRCRKVLQEEALKAVSEAQAKVICLGGLTGALSLYGRRLQTPAEKLGITITTGHSLTALSVHGAYWRALRELGIDPSHHEMAILGLGSIGRAFAELLVGDQVHPKRVHLVEVPNRAAYVEKLAAELRGRTSAEVSVELTDASGQLAAGSTCYSSRLVISAVSTPYVIDIDRVAPGTVLIDDSQPYCWSREAAWARCSAQLDIAPCEAGLVDCRSLGYRSHFPFDFADHGAEGSTTSWSCLAEGLLRGIDPALPETVGEPTLDTLARYRAAFEKWGLSVPRLQCGSHELPIAAIRKGFHVP